MSSQQDYTPTLEEQQTQSVFTHIVNPAFTQYYNSPCTQSPGLHCNSITTDQTLVDHETKLQRGTQSYGVLPETSASEIPAQTPTTQRFEDMIPTYSALRDSKSCYAIHENQRDIDTQLYPTQASNLHETTPYIESTQLFGIDSRQAIKFGKR